MTLTRSISSHPPTSAAWYSLDSDAVASALGVDPPVGLPGSLVTQLQHEHGPNRLAEAAAPPRWRRFLSHFRGALSYILMAAALVALLVGDLKDPIVIGAVLVLNAVLGYVQESRAEGALDALRQMLSDSARVRRDGRLEVVPSDELVPGDVVLLESGDRIPADGRLTFASRVAVDESALTGESTPAEKAVAALDHDGDVPVSDRRNMVFMNTSLVAGRAEMIVTAIGMSTEMGRVAAMLTGTPVGPTPLQRQIDRLGKRLAVVAIAAVLVVLGLRLWQGEPVGEAVLAAVALAVAAIPEGLPAVVAVTLAVGVSQMARRRAIVRRLPSVETLGSTTVICSDKTGTLTVNQMTVRALIAQGRRTNVSGNGYERRGRFSVEGAEDPIDVDPLLRAAVLASDAVVEGDTRIGDPTEIALVVAAAKAGIDSGALRDQRPRLTELPFDSAAKFMVTVNGGDETVAHMKGAPEAVMARCDRWRDDTGRIASLDEDERKRQLRSAAALAAEGMRVLAIAARPIGAEAKDDAMPTEDFVLEGLVGMIDPVRPEASSAVRLCRSAGIDVKMITGDHPTTARTIARALGILGDVKTGTELDAMSDSDLVHAIADIGVCARVAPEHKVRVVRALQAAGEVVAMTGDGVNDAPALRRAEIGVAMGATGTEVTKEAADMVLTDDNFATIVDAVRRGRTIYDNILSFVRFQLSTNVGAVMTMLMASVLGMPIPLAAMQLLWVNIIADGPPAMTLGLEPPASDVMQRQPRRPDEPLVNRSRLMAMVVSGLTMMVGTLTVFHLARHQLDDTVAQTMAFTTFVVMQLFNVLNARSETRSVFGRDTFRNGKLWFAVAAVAILQVLVTTLSVLQSVFDTTALALDQWLVCVGVAASVLVVEELRKLVVRVVAMTNR